MALFWLLLALGETIAETIKETVQNHHAMKERLRYEDIHWDNIDFVLFEGTETAYRIEEREEYDPTYTIALSKMNGAPCYGTKTVEYEVENGLNYCFTIKYKDGTEIYRVFHETSSLTERLLEYHNKNMSDIAEGFNDVADALGNLFTSEQNPVSEKTP